MQFLPLFTVNLKPIIIGLIVLPVCASAQGFVMDSGELAAGTSGRVSEPTELLMPDRADGLFLWGVMVGLGNFNSAPCHVAGYLKDARTGVTAPPAEWIACGVVPFEEPAPLNDRLEVEAEPGRAITGLAICEDDNTREMAGIRIFTKSIDCVLQSGARESNGFQREREINLQPNVAQLCQAPSATQRVGARADKCNGNWQERVDCIDGEVVVGFELAWRSREDLATAVQITTRYAQGVRVFCRSIRRQSAN